MGLIVDFSYKTSLGTGQYKNFTNFLSDKDEYIKSITHILYKMIPEISKHNINDLRNNRSYHTHLLNGTKLEETIAILREIVKNCYDYSNDEAEKWIDNQGIYMQKLWQIACPDSQGIRIIGILEDDSMIFHVLFIDYYHQLFPSEKHNQQNIEKNKFSILEYLKENG